MNESALHRTLFDPFKMPHVQLSAEGSILSLSEEHGEYFGQPIGIMYHETAAAQNPADHVLNGMSLDVLHEIVKATWELALRPRLSLLVTWFFMVPASESLTPSSLD